MAPPKKTVLITGCSDGGLGAALAVSFHSAGFHVYATSRDTTKMKELQAMGIETHPLDVLSDESIAVFRAKIDSLDILVNNAGRFYTMPLMDVDIKEAKKVHDVNVWAYISMAQAFLPLLRKSSNPMIINNTSITANITVPLQGIYNSSKASIAMLTDTLRLELEPFGIKVVDLRTGLVRSNLIKNLQNNQVTIPDDSIYQPAKKVVEEILTRDDYNPQGVPLQPWADLTVRDIVRGPASVIWRGADALTVRIMAVLPAWFDWAIRKRSGMSRIEEALRAKA